MWGLPNAAFNPSIRCRTGSAKRRLQLLTHSRNHFSNATDFRISCLYLYICSWLFMCLSGSQYSRDVRSFCPVGRLTCKIQTSDISLQVKQAALKSFASVKDCTRGSLTLETSWGIECASSNGILGTHNLLHCYTHTLGFLFWYSSCTSITESTCGLSLQMASMAWPGSTAQHMCTNHKKELSFVLLFSCLS